MSVVVAGREREEWRPWNLLLNALPDNQTQPCALGLDRTWEARMGKEPGKQQVPHYEGERYPTPRNTVIHNTLPLEIEAQHCGLCTIRLREMPIYQK